MSFRDLIVWHRSIELCVAIYEYTRAFPKEELFGLRSQLQRASVSVSSNIAEGSGRRSGGEFAQFLCMAQGSNNEVQTQLTIAGKLDYGVNESRLQCEELSIEVAKMLNALIGKIESKRNTSAAAKIH